MDRFSCLQYPGASLKLLFLLLHLRNFSVLLLNRALKSYVFTQLLNYQQLITAGAQGISALDKLLKLDETARVLIPLQPIVIRRHYFLNHNFTLRQVAFKFIPNPKKLGLISTISSLCKSNPIFPFESKE